MLKVSTSSMNNRNLKSTQLVIESSSYNENSTNTIVLGLLIIDQCYEGSTFTINYYVSHASKIRLNINIL